MRLPGSKRGSGAAVVLLDQAAASGTSFLSTVLLVRQLGLVTFGVFSLLWLLVGFAVQLQQALVSQPLMTIAPKTAGAERAPYLGAVLVLQGVYTLACALVAAAVYGYILASWDGDELDGTFAPLVLTVVTKQAHSFVRGAFFARGERRAALHNDLVAYPCQLVVLAALWATDRLDLTSALWAIAACSGLAALLGLARYPERRTSAAVLAETAERHWRFARWLVAMLLAQFFAANSFLVAAGALLGVGTVGAIKAAHTVVGVLHLVFLSMENVLPVSAARVHFAHGTEALLRYLARFGALGLAATALVSGALVAFPRLLLSALYDDAVSAELVLALRALAALYVFVFASSLLQIAFRTLERTRPVFLAYAANTAFALLLAYPVVERFGLAGALCGMIGQQVLMSALLLATLALLIRRARVGDAHPRAAQ